MKNNNKIKWVYTCILMYVSSCTNPCIWNAGANHPYDGFAAYDHYWMRVTKEVYENTDGSKTVYLVDSLYLNPSEYTLVQSESNWHTFLLPDSIYKNKRRLTLKFILNSSDCYIVHKSMWFFTNRNPDAIQIFKEDYYYSPPTIALPFDGNEKKGDFQTVKFEYPPTYYRLFLIRGDVFNIGTSKTQPPIYLPIRFPNEKSFYKLLIPVWDNGDNAEIKRLRE